MYAQRYLEDKDLKYASQVIYYLWPMHIVKWHGQIMNCNVNLTWERLFPLLCSAYTAPLA